MIIILAVLAGTKPNTLNAMQKQAHQRQSQPPDFRSRITLKTRSKVVELYISGLSALDVGQRLGIGKSTVLKILKREGVDVRPRGRRLT